MLDRLVRSLAMSGAIALGACQTNCASTWDYQTFYPPNNTKPIAISNKVQNSLFYIYKDQPNEIPVCLLGHNYEHQLRIDDIAIPPIGYSDNRSANYDDTYCHKTGGYVGMVHNHPNNFCGVSAGDLARFLKDERADIEVVFCGINEDGTIKLHLLPRPVEADKVIVK